MDPGRQAMISGWKAGDAPAAPRQDPTAPRRDPNTRVTKPPREKKPRSGNGPGGGRNQNKYLTLDQQSERFVAEEDKFVLKQAKKKADIRVRERRAKPIDYLAFNLRYIDADRDMFDDDEDDVEIEVPAPEKVLGGLGETQLKELDEDIKSYLSLETNARNKEYWTVLLSLCEDRRQKLKPQGPEGRAVNSVASDIDKILAPHSYEKLVELEKKIKSKLDSDEQIDTDYWEALLKSLLVWKAKAKLRKLCEAIREAWIEALKLRNPEKARLLEEAANPPSSGTPSQPIQSLAKPPTLPVKPAAAAAPFPVPEETDSTAPPPGTSRFATTSNEDFSTATKALYEREVARGISEDEEIFQAEEAIVAGPKPHWANKYRPRKPRYFNRVQMGYEWNKYNQTHYDHDNPPPRVVQGYRFNIFYPELIDKTKAPTYKIIREHGRRRGESFAPAGEEDTCLIRFMAGPPYEDIAFRIVDREWDFSAKKERGFRSSFDKGILQLHFQFKKVYYRK